MFLLHTILCCLIVIPGIESSGGKRPSYSNPKKRKVFLDDPYPIGFRGVTFRYEKEFGNKIEYTLTPISSKSHTWFNISISRSDYLHIIDVGLDIEWEVTIRHLSNKPVTLRHNHYRKSNIDSNNIIYKYNINTNPLFTNKEMIYQNQITIIDRMYSVTIHFWFRISLIDPAIETLNFQLLSDGENATSIPHPFKNPARSLNLIIPLITISQKYDVAQLWTEVFLPDDIFYFHIHSRIPIVSPKLYVISAALFKQSNNRLGPWRVHRNDEQLKTIKCNIIIHESTHYQLLCALKLTSWVQFNGWNQIGWRFHIKNFKSPSFNLNIEFISKNEVIDIMQPHQIQNLLNGWFATNDNWFNIDKPEFSLHDKPNGNSRRPLKDGLIIDRNIELQSGNIMKYVSKMVTNQKHKYNIFNDEQFPFHHELMRFKGESGIDHGSLSQEYFQTIFKSLSKRLINSDSFQVKIAHGLIRMWIMCLKQKSNFKIDPQFNAMPPELECRMKSSYFNALYFEIIFGKLDRLFAMQNIDNILQYLMLLSTQNIIADWVPLFVNKYLKMDSNLEQVTFMLSTLIQVMCKSCLVQKK